MIVKEWSATVRRALSWFGKNLTSNIWKDVKMVIEFWHQVSCIYITTEEYKRIIDFDNLETRSAFIQILSPYFKLRKSERGISKAIITEAVIAKAITKAIREVNLTFPKEQIPTFRKNFRTLDSIRLYVLE